MKKTHWVLAGATACWMVCIGDFLVNTLLGLQVPGYSFMTHTESFLGRTGMPTAPWIAVWSVAYSLLFIVFALGWQAFFSRARFVKFLKFDKSDKAPSTTRWVHFSTWLLIIYGVGEGIGSGFIPFDKVAGRLTFSGYLHQIVSGIADTCLFIFPILAARLLFTFYKIKIRLISWIVIGLGLIFNVVFLLGKESHHPDELLNLMGLWQRLFLLVYYCYLMFLAIVMVKNTTSANPVGK